MQKEKITIKNIGTVEYSPKDIIIFEKGLLGFEELTQFLLIQKEEEPLFTFLQPLAEINITFILIRPQEIMQNYQLSYHKEDTAAVVISGNKMIDYAIVTIPENIEEMTMNLLGPLLINLDNNKGIQVVSKNENHTTKHCILDEINKSKKLDKIS